MNIVSDVEWEIEQIKGAIEYYKLAQNLVSDYESHLRYSETIKKLESQLKEIKGERVE